jgi:hypothetical protein
MGRELIIFDRPIKKVSVVDPMNIATPGLGELSVPPRHKEPTGKSLPSARAMGGIEPPKDPVDFQEVPRPALKRSAVRSAVTVASDDAASEAEMTDMSPARPIVPPAPLAPRKRVVHPEGVPVPDVTALAEPNRNREVWAKEIAAQAFPEPAPRQDKKPKKGLLGGLFGNRKTDAPVTDESLDTERLYQKGLATIKDLIAPPAIRVTPATIQIGDVVARTLFVIAYPRFLSTNWFSPIINLDFPMDTALFIHPIETAEILKQLRKSATQVQSQMNIEVEEGKIRDPVLEAALQNIEELRDRLQQGTEKFFRFGLYMMLYGADEKDLSQKVQSVEAILEAQLVYTKPAVLRQDAGFASTRPLANDALDVANNLNTEPLSTTFPFVSSDLSSNEGILYGINRHNNSLILFDRFKMENANMVVFAKSGAGKSYTVKLEVLRALMFESSVIIIDPENEYKHLCETVGGAFLKISLNSDIHLNPFDMPKVSAEDESDGVFRNTIANLIGLLHLMLGTLSAEEDSILDQAIREAYAIRDIHEDSNYESLTAQSFPTMSDLYAVLKNMEGADSIAARLQRYTEGIFSGFLNEQTNIDTDNQLVVFNIRDLEEELRPIAMYIILQYIWNDIRSKLRQRIIVVDEAWIMMQNEDAASFLFGIAKRCRKYYTGLTTITQDISDFMSSRYGKPIITNSSMQLLLRQSPASIDYITETFYLTDHEKFLLLESNVGEGIFFAGTKHAAIKVIASYSEDQIITSDPRQLLEIEEAKREFDAQNP